MEFHATLSFIMFDIDDESSDDLYVLGDSEDSETSDSDLFTADDELFDNGDPTEDEGWKSIFNIFVDKRPGAIPPLSDDHTGENAAAQSDCFTTPGNVFGYVFDDEMMVTLCL